MSGKSRMGETVKVDVRLPVHIAQWVNMEAERLHEPASVIYRRLLRDAYEEDTRAEGGDENNNGRRES